MNPIRIELPTGLDVGSVNVYLFPTPEPVLIDAGVDSDESWAALQAALAEHGLTAADLHQVIITHAHVDHFGGAWRVAHHGRAQIYVADLGYDWLVDPRQQWLQRTNFYADEFLAQCALSGPLQQMAAAYMQWQADTAVAIDPSRVTPFYVGDWLQMGGLPWQVLHMPGHASHQTCFYQPQSQQLIAADMLLHKTPTPVVEDPPPGQPRQPALPIFLESLARLEALPIQIAYPGHGREITEPLPLMQQQRARIHARKNETLALIQQGNRTVADLLEKLYGHYPVQTRLTGLWMLVGYLDLLKAENRIVEEVIDGAWHYTAV